MFMTMCSAFEEIDLDRTIYTFYEITYSCWQINPNTTVYYTKQAHHNTNALEILSLAHVAIIAFDQLQVSSQ